MSGWTRLRTTAATCLQQFLNNAEFQLNNLKAGWSEAKARAIARGAHIGPTPLGYERVPKPEPNHGTLRVKSGWKPLIKKLFARAASTDEGGRLLAKWANQHAKRPDGRRWTSNTIGHLLRNRVYRGEVRYVPRTDPDEVGYFEPLVNEDAHEAMVDEETWRNAQRAPGVQKVRADSSPVNLLVGLVRCAGCRYRMAPSRGAKMMRVYRCKAEHGAGRCPTPATIKAEKLEDWAQDEVRRQLEIRREVAAPEALEGELEEAHQELLDAREELDAFGLDLKARKKYGDRYHAYLDARTDAVEQAEARYRELAAQIQEQDLGRIDWDSLEADELRAVLGGAIDAVFVRRGRMSVSERAVIVWRGELDEDAPSRGRATDTIRPFAWPEGDQASAGEASA